MLMVKIFLLKKNSISILKTYLQSNWDDIVVEVSIEFGDLVSEMVIEHLQTGEKLPNKFTKKKKLVQYIEAMKFLFEQGIEVYDFG